MIGSLIAPEHWPAGMITPWAEQTRVVRQDDGSFKHITPYGQGPAGYTLRLANSFITKTAEDGRRPFHPRSDVDRYLLMPGKGVLISTVEFVVMPDDLSGQIMLNDKYSSIGLTMNTRLIQPGFEGNIQAFVYNAGGGPAVLWLGQGIVVLSISRLE